MEKSFAHSNAELLPVKINDISCFKTIIGKETFIYYMMRCCKKLLDINTESLDDLFSSYTGADSDTIRLECPYCENTIPDHVLHDLLKLNENLKENTENETRQCMFCVKDINEWGVSLICGHAICQKCIKEKVIKSSESAVDAKCFCRFCCKFQKILEIFNGNNVVESNIKQSSSMVPNSDHSFTTNQRNLIIPDSLKHELIDPLKQAISILKK